MNSPADMMQPFERSLSDLEQCMSARGWIEDDNIWVGGTPQGD